MSSVPRQRSRSASAFPAESAPFAYELGNDIPGLKEMPIVERFVEEHEAAQPLRGVTALLIQHQLGNQAPQVEALVRLGLDPKKLFWLDIPYTSSSRFRVAIADRLNIPDENFWVHRYRVLEAYDAYQLRRTQEIVRELLRLRPKRLVVLDDGAYFVAAASTFRNQFPSVAVVEQTTRGLIKLDENPSLAHFASQIPIVNVARSEAKRQLESPWIGVAVVASLDFHLRALARRSPAFAINPGAPALVIGYGAVGRSVAEHLRGTAKVRVFVWDTNPDRLLEAQKNHFDTWDRKQPGLGFKLVVGCSGTQSFGAGDFVYLDRRAVLASASSGSVELSRRDVIEYAATSQIDDVKIDTRWLIEDQLHQELRIHLVDRQVVFLNAGFPINFDGRLNCVPATYMQPTALLMIQGAIQASRANRVSSRGPDKYIPVDPGVCERLTKTFLAQLSPKDRKLVEAASP
jgi:S-adenosylhomocysteine hydrolase